MEAWLFYNPALISSSRCTFVFAFCSWSELMDQSRVMVNFVNGALKIPAELYDACMAATLSQDMLFF